MGNVIKSQPQDIQTIIGNGLSVFVNGTDGLMYVKDVMGNAQLLSDYIAPNVLSYNYGLFAQTSLSTPVVSASGEASLIGTGVGTLSVPPNTFQVGDSFNAKLCGKLSCANNQDLHIRVKSNGNIIIDAGIFTLSITTNKYYELSLDFTITKIGGLGVAELFANGQFSYNKNANSNIDGINFALIDSTSFDTTISNTLTITAEWVTSNIANSIQSQNFVLTKVY